MGPAFLKPAWRYVVQSLRGTSHEAEGTPCQDASAVTVLGDGEASCLVACVADGAGSAQHSDFGSQMVCKTILQQAEAHHAEQGGFSELKQTDAVAWIEAARQRIQEEAEKRECEVRQFASTLLAVVATPTQTYFFQVGDGAIILGRHGLYGVVFWPQSGEYANSTNFITMDRFEDELDYISLMRPLDEVALFTDGLERLALNFEAKTPHTPFCSPLFAGLNAADDLEKLGDDLRKFLGSESVSSRSDDDKSLILATRREAPRGTE